MNLDKEENQQDKKSISVEEQKQVWLAAWCATASSGNSNYSYTPGDWADKCLDRYLERFDN